MSEIILLDKIKQLKEKIKKLKEENKDLKQTHIEWEIHMNKFRRDYEYTHSHCIRIEKELNHLKKIQKAKNENYSEIKSIFEAAFDKALEKINRDDKNDM